MRIILSLLLAATLSLFAQDAPKGKGKGGPPKNLQILTPETFRAAMTSFTQALGVQCTFCHVDDRSADDKEEKKTARMMLTMVREINAKFPDGKQHVTCYTCHRGAEMPLTAAPAADGDKK